MNSCIRPLADSHVPFASAIDLTPQVLTNVIEPLCAYNGWMISLVGAGPVPEDKGKIGTIS